MKIVGRNTEHGPSGMSLKHISRQDLPCRRFQRVASWFENDNSYRNLFMINKALWRKYTVILTVMTDLEMFGLKERYKGKAWGEANDRGSDGWMASQWTWVWANSERLWRTGKPGVLQSLGSQRVEHSWATEQQKFEEGREHDIPFGLEAWWRESALD